MTSHLGRACFCTLKTRDDLMTALCKLNLSDITQVALVSVFWARSIQQASQRV